MARLTMEEKFKIQQELISGKTVKEIAEEFGRTEKTIAKYKQEFQNLANHYAKPEDIEEFKQNPVKEKVQLSEEAVLSTLQKLRSNGIDADDAKAALNKVTSDLTAPIDDSGRLTALCLQQLNAKRSMITEAVGGRDGVAIMTSAASQIIEEQNKYQPTRSERDCIFNPKTGEVT